MLGVLIISWESQLSAWRLKWLNCESKTVVIEYVTLGESWQRLSVMTFDMIDEVRNMEVTAKFECLTNVT